MTAANATSYRKRFRYANELRRYSQTAKWNTVASPKPPQLLDLTPLAGGIVKLLLAKASGYNANLEPTVEWSLNGTSGWTAVALTGWTAGSQVLTTATVAAGVKFFRVKCVNTFSGGPYSNSRSTTVLA